MSRELGRFVRAQRDRLAPADVGLLDVGRRRVAGLRREEVALLAGISVDYYVRLEQGREPHPSVQVLEALASALRLTDDARDHLMRLAGAAPPARRVPVKEVVDAALRHMLEQWASQPALVLGRAYDVLATNDLAEQLFSGFPVSRNLLVELFLDDDAITFYADWEHAARSAIAGWRHRMGIWPGDPRFAEIRDMLLAGSPEFARLWGENRVQGKSLTRKQFRHSEVGDLTLDMLTFDVRNGSGQQLIVYQAVPDSPSDERLKLLGSLAATRARPS
jgi:transcriptional regulator with XRE-family HTH domain